MAHFAPIRPVRFWPLIFSVLAVWPLLHFVPPLYEDIQFSLRGVHTIGWYSDFGPDVGPYKDNAGRAYFIYAYRVGNVTYAGRGLYDDDTSDIYFRKPGDPIGVTYLEKAPWVSTMRSVRWDLKVSAVLMAIPLFVFLGGIFLSLIPRHRTSEGD
jgi:hypothetical protein